MCIKYEEYELLELFMNEPFHIEPCDKMPLYFIKDKKGFKLIMSMSVYEKTCSVAITFNDLIVFSADFENVTSLKKHEKNFLIININDEPKIRLNFLKQLGVELI